MPHSFGLYVYIAIGGALGACLRHFLMSLSMQLLGKGFPFGTLLVNILGSFLLGLLYNLIEQGSIEIVPWRSLLSIGFLGALTTFSTFSVDSLLLMQQGYWLKAVTNILSNVFVCLFAAWLGIQVCFSNS